MDLHELAAREQLRELVARYAHCADTGRFDALAALFAPDGVLELDDGRTARGPDAIRAFLGGAAASLAGATGTRLVRHHVSNLALDVDGPDAARGAAYFFVITERGPDHWGRYRDRYVRLADGWRFAHRRVRVDGMAPDSWAAERRGRPQSA